jgi:hypothetical protein
MRARVRHREGSALAALRHSRTSLGAQPVQKLDRNPLRRLAAERREQYVSMVKSPPPKVGRRPTLVTDGHVRAARLASW